MKQIKHCTLTVLSSFLTNKIQIELYENDLFASWTFVEFTCSIVINIS